MVRRSPSVTLQRGRLRRRRWLIAAAVAAVAAAVTIVLVVTTSSSGRSGPSQASGPSSSGAPRPVTDDEANRLAAMRFANYRSGLHLRLTTNAGLSLVGDIDYHRRVGYAMATDAGRTSPLQWSATKLVNWAWPPGAPTGEPPAALPTTQTRVRTVAATTSDLDALLTILLALGQDRPDNATLIRQDGAMFVRADSVDGVPVDVLQGPRTSGAGTASGNPLTYWVDATGHLRRVDVVLGRASAPIRVDTDPDGFRSFAPSPLLTS